MLSLVVAVVWCGLLVNIVCGDVWNCGYKSFYSGASSGAVLMGLFGGAACT